MMEKTNIFLLAIVSIVAVVGIVVLVMSTGTSTVSFETMSISEEDLAGKATSTSKPCIIYCTDESGCYDEVSIHSRHTNCGVKVWSDTRKSSACDSDGDWLLGTLTSKMKLYCGDYTYGYVMWGEDVSFVGQQTSGNVWNYNRA